MKPCQHEERILKVVQLLFFSGHHSKRARVGQFLKQVGRNGLMYRIIWKL